jgi:serine/threonine-protein kinase
VIEERVGTGGMGEVYRAKDAKLKRTVALKRLATKLRADPRYRRRFQEEAERASRFVNGHVASVYDVLEDRGEMFLVMEYVEGRTLRERLREPMTLEQFFGIARECTEGLLAAHGAGIVHCDVKPENIMLTGSGHVKILDFGLAKHLPRPEKSSTVDAGGVTGTPAYMSPEVLLEKSLDGRADIFSLGIVFYEALAGQHPFLADSFVETIDRIRNETPVALRVLNPGVPPSVEQLVSKAMAKAAENRQQSARELRDELVAAEAGITKTGRLRLLPAPSSVRKKKPNLLAVGAAVLGLAVGLYLSRNAIVHWFHGTTKPPVHLAILPFVSTGDDPRTKALGDGLTATLTAKLTQLTGNYPLQVVPTTEVRAENITSVERAKREFGANLVLEGTLQESGERVRVTYSLVDTKTMREVSADTITVDSRDVFGVQDRVAEDVVSMLGLQLGGKEHTALAAHGTQEPAAYDYYLRGLGYLQDYHRAQNVSNAIQLFERALERDSKYALAYAGLGQAYWAEYDMAHEPEWIDKAAQACQRSVELGPDLADGHTCLGTVYTSRGKYEDAVQQFQRALQMDPTSESAYRGLASAYEKLGREAEAEKTFQMAVQMRPQYWAGYEWLGYFYGERARYAEAEREFKQAIALAPDDPHGYRSLGGIYIYTGNYAKAIEVLEHANSLSPTAEAYSNLGIAYFNLRRFGEAVAASEHTCGDETKDYISCGNLARAYYWSPGMKDRAAKTYERAIELAEVALQINPRDGDAHVMIANYRAMLGERSPAMSHLQEALSLSPKQPEYMLIAAVVHNRFGEKHEALDWLEKAVKAGYSRAEIQASPELDTLRSEIKFQQIIQGK